MNWPFRRKSKNETTVPLEVQEYYQTERRERTGVAWLLALGTLIVTVLLALLLFFGGRWLYRTITNDDADTAETTSQEQQGENTDTNTPADSNQDTNNNGTTGTSSTNTDQSTQGQSTTGTPAPTTPAPATPPAPTATTPPAPSTASNDDDLPNTGPGEMIGLIAATAIAGTVAYHVIIVKRYEA